MPGTVSRRAIAKGAAWSMPVIALAGAAPAARASQALILVVPDMWATYDPDTKKFTFSATISLVSGDWSGMQLDVEHRFYKSIGQSLYFNFSWPLSHRPTGTSFVSHDWFATVGTADHYAVRVYSAMPGYPSRTLLADTGRIPITIV